MYELQCLIHIYRKQDVQVRRNYKIICSTVALCSAQVKQHFGEFIKVMPRLNSDYIASLLS